MYKHPCPVKPSNVQMKLVREMAIPLKPPPENMQNEYLLPLSATHSPALLDNLENL